MSSSKPGGRKWSGLGLQKRKYIDTSRAVQTNVGAQGKNPLGGPFPYGRTSFTFLSFFEYFRTKYLSKKFTNEFNSNKLKACLTCAFECKRVNNV